MSETPKGPYTRWVDYGTEGWKPTNFATLNEALFALDYGHDWVVMRPVHIKIIERPELHSSETEEQAA